MQAARLYAANGLQLGQSYELDAIAAVILGGTSFVGGVGSIWGTLIGADDRCLEQRPHSARRIRCLAVHRQGRGDHRGGRPRPVPADRRCAHVSAPSVDEARSKTEKDGRGKKVAFHGA
jgi:hypothetical protein